MVSNSFGPSSFFHDLLHKLAEEHAREVEELRWEVARLRPENSAVANERGFSKCVEASSDDIRTGCIGCITTDSMSNNRVAADDMLHQFPSVTPPSAHRPDDLALGVACGADPNLEDFPDALDEAVMPEKSEQRQRQPQPQPQPQSNHALAPILEEDPAIMEKKPSRKKAAHVIFDTAGIEDNTPVMLPRGDSCLSGRSNGSQSVLDRWTQLVQAKVLLPVQAQLLEVWEELDEFSKFVYTSMPQKELTAMRIFAQNERLNMMKEKGEKKTARRQRRRPADGKCTRMIGMWNPTSPKRISWDIIGAFILAHDLVIIPLQVFEQSTTGLPETYQTFESIFDFIATLFWTVDIMVSFTTGYFSDEGFIEMRPSYIARHYLKTWGALDFFIVSLDWFAIMVKGMGSTTGGYVRLAKTISRFVRIIRLLRLMKLSNAIKSIAERVNSEYILTMGGLFRLVVLIVFFAHYLACAWYGISQVGEKSWADKFLAEDDSLSYAYSTSLHWSLTQFTPASMEVVPQNPYERFYNCCVIVMALVTFSSFVSSITSAMTHLRSINAQQTEQDMLIRRFFSENKVSHEAAAHVWRFLRKSKGTHFHRLKERDVPALKALPLRIRQELRMEVYMPILKPHPLFWTFSQLDPVTVREVCDVGVAERTLQNGEELYASGSQPQSLFFIVYGSMKYCSEVETIPLLEGDWACESSLWAAGLELQGCFVSIMDCELLLLSAEGFTDIMKNHTDLSGFLTLYAKSFIKLFNDASLDEKFTNTLLNDRDILAHLTSQACEEFIQQIKTEEEHVHEDDTARPRDAGSVIFQAAHTVEVLGARQKMLKAFNTGNFGDDSVAATNSLQAAPE